jgi:hypothetical protein
MELHSDVDALDAFLGDCVKRGDEWSKFRSEWISCLNKLLSLYSDNAFDKECRISFRKHLSHTLSNDCQYYYPKTERELADILCTGSIRQRGTGYTEFSSYELLAKVELFTVHGLVACVAKHAFNPEVRKKALEKCDNDKSVLAYLAKYDVTEVRRIAAEKLTAMGHGAANATP